VDLSSPPGGCEKVRDGHLWAIFLSFFSGFYAAKVQKPVDTTKLFHNYFIDIQWDKLFIRRDYLDLGCCEALYSSSVMGIYCEYLR
jgi:hypothetical protein